MSKQQHASGWQARRGKCRHIGNGQRNSHRPAHIAAMAGIRCQVLVQVCPGSGNRACRGLAASCFPVEDSLNIIRTVFAAPETYAVVLKETGEPVGSIGVMFGDGLHSAEMQADEAEIGYWIGKPYWGRGLIPEAVRCLLRRCFEDLGMAAVWCGYYEGNTNSRRVMDKCGFRFHHTEGGKTSPLGDVRTEHFMRMTKEEWERSNAGTTKWQPFD